MRRKPSGSLSHPAGPLGGSGCLVGIGAASFGSGGISRQVKDTGHRLGISSGLISTGVDE